MAAGLIRQVVIDIICLAVGKVLTISYLISIFWEVTLLKLKSTDNISQLGASKKKV